MELNGAVITKASKPVKNTAAYGKVKQLLRELSDDEDEDDNENIVPATSSMYGDSQRPWLQKFHGYLNSKDQLVSGMSIIQCSHIVHYMVQLEALGDCSVELGPKPGRALGPMRPARARHSTNDDVTSFRSVLKKAVQEAVPSGYALHAPPTTISREARTMFLKDRATQLLQDSEYLLGDVNEQHLQGKKLLFSHPVLKQVCLYVYYSNTSKSLRTFGEFQRSVPKKALALVAAMVHFVLTLYKKHGRDTNLSLSSKELEDIYKKIMRSMDKLATHRSKGYRFEAMLTQWTAEGMYEAVHKYSEPSLT
ncbi:hypothetical protein EV363DRAFT_1292094 [Boletus edulis]|nr:hypothetical protein EV363DRAFT_1292094 [Boletus edulis]